jgi:mannose/cellobiose epimerase-like protein (N-acyl-D-glucosamine 2-epimerase family)
MPHASRSTSLPELTALFDDVQQHFVNVIVPLWQGPGWNADMALPFEALDAAHQPLPAQRYRAMACARQLYLFSSLIGVVDNADVRAAALFRSCNGIS